MKILPIILITLLFLSFTGDNSRLSADNKESKVLICTGRHATKYHKYKCRGLNNCKASIKEITLTEAKEKGYSACKVCY